VDVALMDKKQINGNIGAKIIPAEDIPVSTLKTTIQPFCQV